MRIFAQTHLLVGLLTGVVPKLVIVDPGHSVYQKIANETLWKEKDTISLQGNLPRDPQWEFRTITEAAHWPCRWGESVQSSGGGRRGSRPRTGMSPGAPSAQLFGSWSRHNWKALLRPQSPGTCTQAQGDSYLPVGGTTKRNQEKSEQIPEDKEAIKQSSGAWRVQAMSEQGPHGKKNAASTEGWEWARRPGGQGPGLCHAQGGGDCAVREPPSYPQHLWWFQQPWGVPWLCPNPHSCKSCQCPICVNV